MGGKSLYKIRNAMKMEKKISKKCSLREFYHIDNRDTMDEKEFLTEIQLRLIKTKRQERKC